MPRIVPVLADFEADLAPLLQWDLEELLVGGTQEHRNRASNLIRRLERPRGTPTLSTRRLRSTWLAHHLTIGTRLPELAAAAGLEGVAVLGELLAGIPPLDQTEATAMLRGRR